MSEKRDTGPVGYTTGQITITITAHAEEDIDAVMRMAWRAAVAAEVVGEVAVSAEWRPVRPATPKEGAYALAVSRVSRVFPRVAGRSNPTWWCGPSRNGPPADGDGVYITLLGSGVFTVLYRGHEGAEAYRVPSGPLADEAQRAINVAYAFADYLRLNGAHEGWVENALANVGGEP